ncbi:phage tail protein [Bartonella schoenbuchensis]|uniref:Microcystin-dependent protein n=1 Tax=Bartonella schoenbuchensis (strain DSM 13525 / NCTC 13165 / R1) TaxID=687861 RepID=E6Z063_BARSR|nr:phage tail protein [Bartonella schoenbuchensis]AQX30966.1 Microcystin-dependent protein [Bartonella schoenbuchensis R1]CBI82501.1 Phage related protein [Bartonella schoenbuchensis R1]
MSDIYDWSLTADTNAHSDDIINWAQGQPPSSVNNSARAMMQRIREYLADNGGTIEAKFIVNSEGKTTSITLNTISPITEYKNDVFIRFRASDTNVGATTITVNRLSEKPVYKMTDAGVISLEGGELQKDGIYELIYNNSTLTRSLDGWYLLNPTPKTPPQIEIFPPGFIATFAMKALPNGWLLCDGASYERVKYPRLFKAIGEHWGTDSDTTFKVPDFRGMFLRGFDDGRGIDKDRKFAEKQQDSLKAHTHGCTVQSAGAHVHQFQYEALRRPGSPIGGKNPAFYSQNIRANTSSAGAHTHSATISSTGAAETRPVNTTVVYAIKS